MLLGEPKSVASMRADSCAVVHRTEALDLIAAGLSAQGWAVCPDFLNAATCADLAAEIAALRTGGSFGAAGIGKGRHHHIDPSIRNDWIHWLDERNLSSAQRQAWQALQDLRLTLNRTAYLGLRDLEAHLTWYPPRGHYAKHVDNFRGTSARVISCVLYLNSSWSAEDGGELQIFAPTPEAEHPQSKPSADAPLVEVTPIRGVLACFLSRDIPHAVKMTQRERLSLTAWFR